MKASVKRWREQERQREREKQRTSPGVLASQGHTEERRPCVDVSMCVCVLREKQWGWEAYIVKNEGLVTEDWFSLESGILWGMDEERKQRREREMKRACNMASQHSSYT